MRFEDEQRHDIKDAVIYCRVSSKAQTKRGDGLNSQETRCRQYTDYKQYIVAHVFKDDLTGKTADRPGVQQLLSFLESERPKQYVVVIDDATRFARRVPVHFELREAIAKAGGILESPSIVFSDDADGELHEYIVASVAQHQSRKNAEQTLNRMQSRSYNGYWVFQAPIGFKYQKMEGRGKVLVHDEPAASIIKEALEGFASGRFDTQVEVKRFLESQPDFPKDLPNGLIRNQRVNDILTRVTYAGYIEVPQWNIPLREGQHDGIITLATHNRILRRLKEGAKTPARKDISSDFPLRGFVTCGDCEKPLTACWSTSKSGKKHPYYMCYNRNCESRRKSIPRAKLENAFSELLAKLQPTQELVNTAKVAFKSFWEQRNTQMENLEKTARQEITKLEKQIELLVDRIVDTDSPTAVEAYEKRIAKFEKDKLIMAEKLSNRDRIIRPYDEMFEHAFQFLANPWKLWSSDRLEDKKTVLKLAFQERLPYHRETGFRTPKTTIPFKVLAGFNMGKCEMAHSGRFELPTP